MTQAFVALGPDRLEVQEVTLRPLGAGDVRVRIAGVGECHSDLSMVNGTLPPSYPMVRGHEAAGVVIEAGADAGVAVRSRVVLTWAVIYCPCCNSTHGQPWL